MIRSLLVVGDWRRAHRELGQKGERDFGESGPSPDRLARQKQLDALGDAETNKMNEIEEAFVKYEDTLWHLLEAYVAGNAEAFRLK